jgi:hypothetical protein
MEETLICRQCSKEAAAEFFVICNTCAAKNAAYRQREKAAARELRLYETKKIALAPPENRNSTKNFFDPDTAREHRYRKGKNRERDDYGKDGEDDKHCLDSRVNSRMLYHGENYLDE